MYDARTDLDQEAMGFIDIAAFASAKTDVMQTNISLHEALSPRPGRRRFDAEAGARADAIVDAGRIRDDFQSQERQQFAVEGARGVEVACGDEDMRDAVDFHRWPPRSRVAMQSIAQRLSRLTNEEQGCKSPRRRGMPVQQ